MRIFTILFITLYSLSNLSIAQNLFNPISFENNNQFVDDFKIIDTENGEFAIISIDSKTSSNKYRTQFFNKNGDVIQKRQPRFVSTFFYSTSNDVKFSNGSWALHQKNQTDIYKKDNSTLYRFITYRNRFKINIHNLNGTERTISIRNGLIPGGALLTSWDAAIINDSIIRSFITYNALNKNVLKYFTFDFNTNTQKTVITNKTITSEEATAYTRPNVKIIETLSNSEMLCLIEERNKLFFTKIDSELNIEILEEIEVLRGYKNIVDAQILYDDFTAFLHLNGRVLHTQVKANSYLSSYTYTPFHIIIPIKFKDESIELKTNEKIVFEGIPNTESFKSIFKLDADVKEQNIQIQNESITVSKDDCVFEFDLQNNGGRSDNQKKECNEDSNRYYYSDSKILKVDSNNNLFIKDR